MDIEATERAFGELLAALGDIVVARSRGGPVDPAGGSTVALARRYRARRRAFDGLMEALDGRIGARDADALANMRAALAWLDELEPTPGARPAPGSIAEEDAATLALRVSVLRRFAAAGAAVRVDARAIDRLTALGALATERDPSRRRAVFEAMAPIWRAVDGDGGDASPYRRLLRASADRWARTGSPIEANAVALGIAPGTIETTLQRILGACRIALEAGRDSDRSAPWDYRFAVGAAARRLDRRIPSGDLLGLNGRYLASLGADPAALGISYDVLPRPGRPIIPVAFTMGMGGWATEQPPSGPWTPRPPWVFATYAAGGLDALGELLHESGHAIHLAAVRARPAFLEWPVDATAFLEGTADMLGWDADEPAWQRRWLGDAVGARDAALSRYGLVALDICWALFEIELHRRPTRRPNDVWTEITADGLGIAPHPDRSWWAIRGQLIESPGYLANYALSAIMAAAVRARTLELRGPWFEGDAGWYGAMTAALFGAGAARTPADLLRSYLGGPLTADPLLADLRRTG